MDEQDGVATAKKQMKRNIGRDKKRRQDDNDKPDVDIVSKSEPPKKPRRKRGDTTEKTQDQNVEVLMQEPDENKPVVDVFKSESPKKPRRKGGETAKKTQDQNAEVVTVKEPNAKLQKRQGRKKRETTTENTEDIFLNEEAEKTNRATKSKRKKNESKTSKGEKTTKLEENFEASDLIRRRLQLCTISKKYVGAHVSIQGGLWNAALEASRIGARAFGLFLRSQRTWTSKPLEESAAEKFRRTCKELEFDPHFILPHSPYLMNLGSPKPDVLQKSRDMLVDELGRCHQLGLTLYNIHPGSHVGEMPVKKCLELIADGINYAHSQVPDVTVVLENMSCQGSTVGGRFEELREIIDLIKDKTRIGVCLDTCHAFAAGHNLSEEEGLKHMLDEFDKIVGLSFLRAVHLNDSKGKVGCQLDRHENIGHGHIGVKGFRQVMNEQRFNEIPMILETPYTADFDEIELLYSLCAESGTTKLNTKKASAIKGTI